MKLRNEMTTLEIYDYLCECLISEHKELIDWDQKWQKIEVRE